MVFCLVYSEATSSSLSLNKSGKSDPAFSLALRILYIVVLSRYFSRILSNNYRHLNRTSNNKERDRQNYARHLIFFIPIRSIDQHRYKP